MKKYNDYRTVPLVIYRDGERHVIGEATINGGEISAVLGESIGAEIMTALDFGHDTVSFDWKVPMQRNAVDEAAPPLPPIKFIFAMPGCSCPWNNGLHGFQNVRGHHINCPILKKEHHADDLCGEFGHMDEV